MLARPAASCKSLYTRPVLDPELVLTDVDRRHWENWWRLAVPPRAWDARWALAIVEDGAGASPERRLLRLIVGGGAVHGRGQRDATQLPWRGVATSALAAFADAVGVAAVIVVERGALRALGQQIEAQLQARQDYVEQGLIALRALKAHVGQRVWMFPTLLELLPTPSYDAVQRTFDLLVPDDTALLAYVIEDDRSGVHASVLARKRRGEIDRVTTHRALRDQLSEAALARSWQTAYPKVLATATERLARPSIGLFLERATLLRILAGPGDQLSRELSAKRVILDPAPGWLLGLLGGATMAAVAGRGARVLAAMLPAAARERATGFAQRAGAAMRDSGMHPFALLGFDPLELLAQLQSYYRPLR
jgi:hypothetical protein